MPGCQIFNAVINLFENDYTVYFSDSKITLNKGESRTFTSDDMLFVGIGDRSPDDISFSLSVSDNSVINVAGNKITAIGLGSTRLTAKTEHGVYAYADVTVGAQINDLSLCFPLGRFLPQKGLSSVDVYLVINGGVLPTDAYKVAWSIDGEEVTGFTGNPLTVFKGDGASLFTVTAEIESGGEVFSAETYAGYYDSFDVPGILCDETQTTCGENMHFSLTDGTRYTEWFVDGEFAFCGNEFDFVPEKAGYYEVYAEVLGCKTDCVTLAANGEVALDVFATYDDSYPELSIRYDAVGHGMRYEVVLTSDGFEKKYYDDDGFIQVECNPGKDVSVAVKALGNDEIKGSDEYTVTTVSAPDAEQRRYMSKKWYGGDYYITDRSELNEFFDHMLYFRVQPRAGSSTKSVETVYVDFPFTSVQNLLSEAFDYSGITGSYNINGAVRGKVVEITIEFYTGNVPSETTTFDAEYHYKQLDAVPAHIDMNGTGRTLFPLCTRGRADVETTDQLFRVAELGFVPVSKAGSAAESAYKYAENIVCSMLTEEMTDYEVAHALYDYIMAKNTYDGKVMGYDIADAVKSSSFYLEAILCDGVSYGVCDAMAKTYSLLCNMAGVRAVRVTGYAGTGETRGGHAWNKVMIGGQWYVVDCTWGDSSIRIKKRNSLSVVTSYHESGSHMYFMKVDAEVAATHMSDSAYHPSTAKTPHNYYAGEVFVTDRGSVPAYIQSSGARLKADLELIAYYLSESAPQSHTLSAYGIERESNLFCAEFKVCNRSLQEAKSILSSTGRSSFYNILTKAGLSYNVVFGDNVFYVVVSRDKTLYNTVLASGSQSWHPFM